MFTETRKDVLVVTFGVTDGWRVRVYLRFLRLKNIKGGASEQSCARGENNHAPETRRSYANAGR